MNGIVGGGDVDRLPRAIIFWGGSIEKGGLVEWKIAFVGARRGGFLDVGGEAFEI